MITALVAAWLVFNVPFRGSITLLLLESIVYSMVSLAIGVLVASLTPSQRVAMLVALSRRCFQAHSCREWYSLDRQHADAFPGPEQHRPGKMASSSSPAESCSRGVGLEHLWRETLVLIGMTLFFCDGRGPELQGEDRMRVLRALLCKEYLQIYRDKLRLRQMIMMPFIQLFLLSTAATFEVKTARVYVIDRDQSSMSRTGLDGRLRPAGSKWSAALSQ